MKIIKLTSFVVAAFVLAAVGLNIANADTGAPVISSISVSSANLGQTIYIYGSNFNQNSFVALDAPYGLSVNATVAQSGTSLGFVLPTGAGYGTHTVQVGEKASSLPLSNSVQLTVVPSQQAATISYIGPTSVSPGMTVYVYGSNFDQTSFVALDSASITPTLTPGGGSLSFVVPANTSVGAHTLRIGQRGSSLPLSNSVSLYVVAASQAPVVSSINPSSATVGATVYVYGLNFTPNTFIGLDGEQGTAIQPSSITLISPTTLSFMIPYSLGLGHHSLAVAEKAGEWSLSNAVSLTVVAVSPPVISVPVNTGNGMSNASTAVLRQQLIQIITLLLQLLQQAAASGALTTDQLTSAFSVISNAKISP